MRTIKNVDLRNGEMSLVIAREMCRSPDMDFENLDARLETYSNSTHKRPVVERAAQILSGFYHANNAQREPTLAALDANCEAVIARLVRKNNVVFKSASISTVIGNDVKYFVK